MVYTKKIKKDGNLKSLKSKKLKTPDLMEWSRKIVERLLKCDHEYQYRVVVSFNPNPFNYDGVDDYSVEIHKLKRRKDWLESGIDYDSQKLLSSDIYLAKDHFEQISEQVEDLEKKYKLAAAMITPHKNCAPPWDK